MAAYRNGLSRVLPLAAVAAAASLAQPALAATPVSGQVDAPSTARPADAQAAPSKAAPAAQPAPAETPAAGAPALAPAETLTPTAKPEPKVLISEVVVKGIEGHPERERLEIAVYDAMATHASCPVANPASNDPPA